MCLKGRHTQAWANAGRCKIFLMFFEILAELHNLDTIKDFLICSSKFQISSLLNTNRLLVSFGTGVERNPNVFFC